VYPALVGWEPHPLLGDSEKHLLRQLAAQDPRVSGLIEERDTPRTGR
jgi:hypothetical protein